MYILPKIARLQYLSHNFYVHFQVGIEFYQYNRDAVVVSRYNVNETSECFIERR